jgi:hypothetical protein
VPSALCQASAPSAGTSPGGPPCPRPPAASRPPTVCGPRHPPWCRPPAPPRGRLGAASDAPPSRAPSPRGEGSAKGRTKRPSSEGGTRRAEGVRTGASASSPSPGAPLTPTHPNPAEPEVRGGVGVGSRADGPARMGVGRGRVEGASALLLGSPLVFPLFPRTGWSVGYFQEIIMALHPTVGGG